MCAKITRFCSSWILACQSGASCDNCLFVGKNNALLPRYIQEAQRVLAEVGLVSRYFEFTINLLRRFQEKKSQNLPINPCWLVEIEEISCCWWNSSRMDQWTTLVEVKQWLFHVPTAPFGFSDSKPTSEGNKFFFFCIPCRGSYES